MYIPQRNSEGYGLNMEAIKQFAKSKCKTFNYDGPRYYSCVAEVAQAEVDGIDVIITDHHFRILQEFLRYLGFCYFKSKSR